MRGNPAKPKQQPPRQTRSGVAGIMVKPKARPKRTPATKPKAKPAPKKKAAEPPKKAPEKPAKQTKPAPVKKPAEKKPRESDRLMNLDERKAEPVDLKLRIQIPKQRTKKKNEPAKNGVASGKVGKRKNNGGPVKKEAVKKAILCLQVVPTKKPAVSIKVEPKRAKSKEKPEKKKPEPKKTRIVIKKEPLENKKSKDGKTEPKNIKKELKDIKNEPHIRIEINEIKKEPKNIKKEPKIKEEKVTKPENVPKEEMIISIKQEKTDEKKKEVKPKTTPRGRRTAKKTEEPIVDLRAVKQEPLDEDEEDTPITLPKIKLEKISPVTVCDDGDEEDNPYLFPGSPVPGPSTSRAPFFRNQPPSKSKVSPITVKQEGAPKPPKNKPVRKKPGRKPAIKIKEEPIVIEKCHREASLNALAKVHCLYENETKDKMEKFVPKKRREVKIEKIDVSDRDDDDEPEVVEVIPTRNLRCTPGMRSVGRHLDILNAMSTSSSSDEEIEQIEDSSKEESDVEDTPEGEVKSPEEKKPEEKKVRKRRKRGELMMDLKDMVVRKRMASLNASAMMAASYSIEKREKRRPGATSDELTTSSSAERDTSDDELVLSSSGESKQVVMINQDTTDLTITGLYTTSTHHERRYCNIAGMQYRISSTSHTQTEATAVSSETLIHTTDHVSLSHTSESGGSVDAGTSSPGGSVKSYTPLGALSSMQPPGQSRPCGSSAFSAPPHHVQEVHEVEDDSGSERKYNPEIDQPYALGAWNGYYQPAGPLISTSSAVVAKNPTTPEPQYPQYYNPQAYDYSGYYSRAYRRPWASSSQMEYMETTAYPTLPHSTYYHYAPPPPPPPPAPSPVCYSQPRLPYMEQSFQCPTCPMQSCPKNVHTGPLTGASKGSEMSEAQTSELATLRPIALALHLEHSGASPGPPSPARGSAGLPPPGSPALSTARNNRWSPPNGGRVIELITPPPEEITIIDSPAPTPPPSMSPPPTDITLCPFTILQDAPKLRNNNKRTREAESDAANGVTKRKRRNSSKNAKNKGKIIEIENPENNNVSKHNNNLTETWKELRLRKTPTLKWSNGWSWEGVPYTAKVFLNTEEVAEIRRCYPAMRHRGGDVIRPRDCILLRSPGPKRARVLPFVAKIAAMWENPDDGEMMVSLLWYYRPEHTEQGRMPDQMPDEIFASRHKDTNSVACIEDKCFVLTYHEYCRYRKSLVAGGAKLRNVVPPLPNGYPRAAMLPPAKVSNDLVFFCRQVYDFRQKRVLKKPPSQSSSKT